MHLKKSGLFLIVVAALMPIAWFGPMLNSESVPANIYGQFAGSVSLILMGITLFLATRIKLVEKLFGALDRVYVLHKWLGVIASATAIYHFTVFVESPTLDTPHMLVPSLATLAKEIGIVAMVVVVLLVIVSLLTVLPYNIWKWTHRLIGVGFALAAFHYVFGLKSIATFSPGGMYLNAFCLLGIGSYLYLLLPHMLGVATKKHVVSSVTNHGSVTEVTVSPRKNGVNHRPGQFVFLSFSPWRLSEIHPFTIASAPRQNGELRFLIKPLGSYTKRLQNTLEAGAKAKVSSVAFGGFTLRPTEGPQAWVAAGVGITPFVAWAEALTPEWDTPVTLYYCVREPKDAILLDQLEHIATRVPAFHVVVASSANGNRLTSGQIIENFAGSVREAHVFFCGPTTMREQLSRELVSSGLRRKNFHYEEFEMRAGLGIRRLVRRTVGSVKHRLRKR